MRAFLRIKSAGGTAPVGSAWAALRPAAKSSAKTIGFNRLRMVG
jgi:hypothetical protein